MAKNKKTTEQLAREQNEKLFDELGAVEDGELCLVLARTAKLGSSNLEVVDVYKLQDGARVVHTVETAYALLEGLLLEEEEELVSTHADSRGVLAFPDALLDEVRACSDYAAAVACVGRRGHWLVPASKKSK